MNFIEINNVSLDYPILHQTHGRSLKKTLFSAATGGKIFLNESENLTVRALNKISINIKSGERVGLYGHNGSGKTTLLKTQTSKILS